MSQKLVFAILLGALTVRLAAGGWWQQRLPAGTKFGFPDSEAYWQLAKAVAAGQPYQNNPDRRIFRTPGYPLLLAGLFSLAGHEPPVLWARWLNAVLGVLAVGGVMGLTRLLFDGRAALLAGAVAALHPDAVSMSTFVLSEAPFCPLMLLHLILWVRAWQSDARRSQAVLAFAGGLAAGAATLVRPSWLLFTPFAVFVGVAAAFVAHRPAVARHAWLGLWLMLGLCLAMSPWWIRNATVTGRFVPTTLQVGESLYDGWNPRATGGSDMWFVDEFRQRLRAEDARQPAGPARPSFEERLDQRMREAAVAWAASHPGPVVALASRKFLRMWNVWPNEPALRNWKFGLVLTVGYVPVLVFGLCGLRRFAGRGWPYVLCVVPAVYFTGLHMIFVGSIRYRQPALLLFIVLAAGFLVQVFARPVETRE